MAFRTREQMEAERPEIETRQREAALKDHAKRSEMSRKRVVITLEEAPKERFTASQGMVVFHGSEQGRSPLSAVYFKSELDRPSTSQEGAEDLDARLRDLDRGDKVSLAGYWAKRNWKAPDGSTKEAWEFKAQNFEKGDVPLADIGKAASARIDALRPDRGPVSAPAQSAGDDEIDRDLADMLAGTFSKPKASPTVSYTSGNIVDDRAQVLVNTVNSQLSEFGNPVMGKGVALEFKSRFPSILKPYGDAIKSGELTPGRALLFDLPDGRKWAALATKDHFKDASQLEWVDKGLKELGEKVRAAGLTSIALPPPGCGNGGLDWKVVEPLVHKHLEGISVNLYARPSGAMEPAAEVQAVRETPPRQAEMFAEPVTRTPSTANAKALAALGGSASRAEPEQSRSAPMTEAELVKAIPSLLRANPGYNPYAGIGSRETPTEIQDVMTAAAAKLESRGFTLRSGFAGGADTAFELGTRKDDLREIFAPWKGFGSNPDSKHEKKRWDQIRRHEEMTGERFEPAKARLLEGAMFRKAEQLAAPHHPKWEELPDGHRKLHSRNMGQVYGPNLDTPARFEMAYTVDGKASGGTGQAIRTAQASGIPVLNLHSRAIREAVMKELGIGPEQAMSREAPPVERGSGVAPRSDAGFDLSIPPISSRSKDDVAYFCKVKDPNGRLSNMTLQNNQYEDGGLVWNTEAQYQAGRFPHDPDLQERIRTAGTPFASKQLAYEHKDETRADWEEVNVAIMAYAITRRKDQNPGFAEDLEATRGKAIVELSTRDGFWGAKPQGDRLVGRDVLGSLLTQSRDGARMDELPPGTSFPSVAKALDHGSEIPEPSIKASMYFPYGNQKREDVKSETTFEAIKAGERTSTTRFDAWGSQDRWERLPAGSVARFYSDKDMRGPSVDVVVLEARRVDLSRMSDPEMKAWSKAEGWSERAGQDFGRKYGAGVQVRYALPDSPEGREALQVRRERENGAPARESVAPSRDDRRSPESPPQRSGGDRQRPAPAQLAAMSDRQKWMAALG
jgi:predicted NAD-dependent protein-ADP-ribosyltransferase YbiA (DUF1768 family)/O-acetyl-ADP-ribose deacetylase (regulator of RNase III)